MAKYMSKSFACTLTEDFRIEGIFISRSNLTSNKFSYPVSTTGRTYYTEDVISFTVMHPWNFCLYVFPEQSILDSENVKIPSGCCSGKLIESFFNKNDIHLERKMFLAIGFQHKRRIL